ncbi:hypothetical protein JRQ81_010069 [Phrynocephalus forsythii]|uniref:Taste receptor type 2 n=1 Tax=Phrynocephalus forsythii TaxID=171643 RepID=A0A9Q0X878_9SAUR|nr:hypothetical protein JRQ81_010069 [Phrynocephalus forsythii]
MFSPPYLVFSIGLILLGLILNGLMMKVLLCKWLRGRRLCPRDQILLSLSASNTIITIQETLVNFAVKSAFVAQIIYVGETFVILCRCWITAWLSVFLCVKIVSCNHKLFLLCKLRISEWVPWLLLGSVFISSLPSATVFWNMSVPSQRNTTAEVSDLAKYLQFRPSVPYLIILLGVFIAPLLLVLLCSILSIASLFSHVCHLKSQGPQFTRSQMKAHIKAAVALICFSLLYLSLAVVETLMILQMDVMDSNVSPARVMINLFFGPGEAAILIAVNPQLKWAVTFLLPHWLLPQSRLLPAST